LVLVGPFVDQKLGAQTMARSSQELKASLRGIVGFGVTPFHGDFSVNLKALRENAESLAQTCDVVVPLGNNGEVYSLSPEEQKQVGRTVVEEVGGRKPVIVGMGFSLPLAVDLAVAAEAYGADGVLILPPCYSHVTDDGLFEYYRNIAAATKLGVVLFQTPTLNFSLPLLRRLAAVPNIVGMKDEHGDMKQFVHQWQSVGDTLELLCGVGEILAPSYFALGVRAFTSGIVNFMPETPLRILELLQEQKLEMAARVVEDEALAIFKLRAKRPGYVTAVIKEAMNLCGMNAGPVRPPLMPLLDQDRKELRTIVEGLGIPMMSKGKA
jgi:dihydrodipicolinate synthase/N-acetylneuraminate lyase